MASAPRFIFRWKDVDGRPIEVTPSVADSEKEVWDWAKKWLRGAGEKDSSTVVKYGEVVPYEED